MRHLKIVCSFVNNTNILGMKNVKNEYLFYQKQEKENFDMYIFNY